MIRIVLVIATLMLISGLAVVHFSLANAQRGLSPLATHEGGTHTLPPSTPLPNASISPSSGAVGSSVRISGSNFGPGETVRIFFDNQQIGGVPRLGSGLVSQNE